MMILIQEDDYENDYKKGRSLYDCLKSEASDEASAASSDSDASEVSASEASATSNDTTGSDTSQEYYDALEERYCRILFIKQMAFYFSMHLYLAHIMPLLHSYSLCCIHCCTCNECCTAIVMTPLHSIAVFIVLIALHCCIHYPHQQATSYPHKLTNELPTQANQIPIRSTTITTITTTPTSANQQNQCKPPTKSTRSKTTIGDMRS